MKIARSPVSQAPSISAAEQWQTVAVAKKLKHGEMNAADKACVKLALQIFNQTAPPT